MPAAAEQTPPQAPTFDLLAIHPATVAGPPLLDLAAAPGALDAAGAALKTRVLATIRFGWALEELIYRFSLMGAAPAASATPGSDFPPDLIHNPSAASRLKAVRDLLAAQEPLVLATPPVSTSGAPGAAAAAPPSPEADVVLKGIDALLQAYHGQPPVDLSPWLTGGQRIAPNVLRWDQAIVDKIVGAPPEVVTGYEVGKALSVTAWRIAASTTAPAMDTAPDPEATAWQQNLAPDRIDAIKRHLRSLAPCLDTQMVTAVAASLSFWQRAYARGVLKREASTPDAPASPTDGAIPDAGGPASAAGIPGATTARSTLRDALNQQADTWYDLLTERRLLASYPITGMVAAVAQTYVQQKWSAWTPTLIPAAIFVVALVALAVALWNFAQGAFSTGVAAGVSSFVSILAARGAGLFERGADAVRQMQARIDDLEARVNAATSDSAPLSFASLPNYLLADVVGQMRLEEFKLAISEPLINFVVVDRAKNEDPREVMRRFLSLVVGDEETNVDRLQSVLQHLYDQYRPALGVPA